MNRPLIASYSYSGSTNRIAQKLQAATGGDWCGTIAPPLASWLSKNDLAGKTILLFYSYCGGVVGNFRKDIVKLCPKADVREPLGIIDDGGEHLEEILREWIARNDLYIGVTA